MLQFLALFLLVVAPQISQGVAPNCREVFQIDFPELYVLTTADNRELFHPAMVPKTSIRQLKSIESKQQRRLQKLVDEQRTKWHKRNSNSSNKEYSFEVLSQRTLPDYRKLDRSQLKDKGIAESKAFFRDYYGLHKMTLDMASWNSKLFPKRLPKLANLKKIDSGASPRQAFLDVNKRQAIEFQEVTIQRINDMDVGLGQHFDFTRLSNDRSGMHKYFINLIAEGSLRLVEVDGIPMLAGPKLESNKDTDTPMWSSELFYHAKVWRHANPDIPFMIGRQKNGDFRVVKPLYKILSRFNFDTIESGQWSQINSSLLRLSEAFRDDLYFRTGPESRRDFGLMLTKNYMLADFGPFGTRFANISRDNLGVYKANNYSDPLSFSPQLDFFNAIRAQILTWKSEKGRGDALAALAESKQYRAWFETIFWISENGIIFSSQKSLKNTNKIPYVVLKNSNADLAREWISEKSLEIHFEKHGKLEMDFRNQGDYLHGAIEFINSKEPFDITIKRLNSDTLAKYNFFTQEFAIFDTSGRVITYYRLTTEYRAAEEFHDYLVKDIMSR